MKKENIKSAVKHVVKTNISYKNRLFLKAALGIIVHPTKTHRNINQMVYVKELLKNPKISFVPPVLTVSMTEQCNLRCPTCLFLLEDKNRFYQFLMSA